MEWFTAFTLGSIGGAGYMLACKLFAYFTEKDDE